MYNYFLSIKDTFIIRFGRVLGYLLMGICFLVTLSVIIFLIKFFLSFTVGLLITCSILFGIYKLSEMIKKEMRQR